MEIDYSMLKTIEPLPDEEYLYQRFLDIDKELLLLNSEIEKIDIETIPFDKTDAVIVFAAAMIECLLDFCFSDPANKNSFACKCNSNNNPIGKWSNSIHERINHKGNPLDFQGRFDANGNVIFNREVPDGPTISFAGGNHRERTYGHDLLRIISAIKQLHDGKFIDSGYIDGVKIVVESCVNQNGMPYEKLSYAEAFVKYVFHMVADFFSSKGLPIPGWSYLSHSDNREIRKIASELYNDGLNFRTETFQVITTAIPEIIVRIVTYLRYRESEYSKEAKKKKRNLLLLMTHGVSTCVNIGKVVITENPVSINLPMIMQTVRLGWKCIKDQVNLNKRSIVKLNKSLCAACLEGERTLLVMKDGVYYTCQYLALCERLKVDIDNLLEERLTRSRAVSILNADYKALCEKQCYSHNTLLEDGMYELSLGEGLDLQDDRALQEYVADSYILDQEINNLCVDELKKKIEL